ncbi:MAG: helix-turn-helix transcriptional regulator [Syntrophomonadaceae bacterium]|nr:helix-turn-helix transcriptional regulator [Syntrophomonadaceae bacterium]
MASKSKELLSIPIDARNLSIIVFSLFSGWELSFVFEGQVLYAICKQYHLDPHAMIFGSIAALFTGLLACGIFIKNIKAAKRWMLLSFALCIAGTGAFLFTPSIIWKPLLMSMAFLAGTCVAAWGFYFRGFTPFNERIKTVAEALIYSNILMILINAVAINGSPHVGLVLSMLMLAGALFFTTQLPEESPNEEYSSPTESTESGGLVKALAFLCLFIFIITINSGLMYQVINPAFAHHQWLVSWYWSVPYIIALYIMKILPRGIIRTYMLYVAIAMIGFAFIAFMNADRSAASYLLINTLMLGACGVFDLFWWSSLGEMLDLEENPAKILGIGLSANVLGVLLGGGLGKAITGQEVQTHDLSMLALVIVFVSLIILPLLHRQLYILLENHAYLGALFETPAANKKDDTVGSVSAAVTDQITARENEIITLIVKGRTYKMIADELHISENTVKSHIKHIYSKLDVKRKPELISLMLENPSADKATTNKTKTSGN